MDTLYTIITKVYSHQLLNCKFNTQRTEIGFRSFSRAVEDGFSTKMVVTYYVR